MKLIETGIEDLFVLEPTVHKDHRGYFLESFNSQTFQKLGLSYSFLQDNESYSQYGTLRGLHYQTGEAAQAKLVRVLEGVVFDVAVDLRPKSKTFAKWFGVELTAENKKQMIIPRGFAHGFVVLSKTALFAYKCDNFYSKENEGGVLYSDGTLDIDWRIPVQDIIISEKDKNLPNLKNAKVAI
ncbi:MAG: dTDP-4-dehydrorhamnose 3,5-epimerase [Bacteriovoracia bacterium]